MDVKQDFWRNCSACKKPIGLGAKYFLCSVSTCNSQRAGYAFCSIPCFEVHLPAARHKDAGAIEKIAPMTPMAPTTTSPAASSTGPVRRIISNSAPSVQMAKPIPKEVLVIASRLKDYIQNRSEFNTSQSVFDVLSDHLRVVCERAIDNARSDGRKTVMDRDFEFLKKGTS